jgi:hypothetical protein
VLLQVQRNVWTRFFSMFIVLLMWLLSTFVLVLAIDHSLVRSCSPPLTSSSQMLSHAGRWLTA